MNDEKRLLVWFSCGAPSACATKLAIDRFGAECVHPIYCDLSKNEDADNVRFRQDCERWFNKPIEVIKNEQYSTIEQVFDDRKYMSGVNGAVCTGQMKKVPRFAYQRPDDTHIFGLTSDEPKRIREFQEANFELHLMWILQEMSMTRSRCMFMIRQAGIALPLRYSQGFKNNNCKCCVKASSLAYWLLERRINPDVFLERAIQSRRIGTRLTRLNGKRIFLDEIPAEDQIPPRVLKRLLKMAKKENVSCGPECKG